MCLCVCRKTVICQAGPTMKGFPTVEPNNNRKSNKEEVVVEEETNMCRLTSAGSRGLGLEVDPAAEVGRL